MYYVILSIHSVVISLFNYCISVFHTLLHFSIPFFRFILLFHFVSFNSFFLFHFLIAVNDFILFYCGHQVREPGSCRGSARSRKSAPAATRSDCTDQRTEAAAAAARFPCLWGTQRTGSCRQPSRQSCCRQWLRGGSGALSPRAMPSQSCACAERPRAPVPGSGAPSGPPGELPWGSSQTLRSTSPRRPSPASCTASEQRSELGKTGSRAQHTPGLLRLLAPPAFLSLHLLLSSFFSSLVGIPSHWPKSQGMIAP